MSVAVAIPSQPTPPVTQAGVQSGVTGDPGYHAASDDFEASSASCFSTVISSVTPTYITSPVSAIQLITAGNAADKAEYTSTLEPVTLSPDSSVRATYRFLVSDSANIGFTLGLVAAGATQALIADGAFFQKASGTSTISCYHAKGAGSTAAYSGGSSNITISSNVWQTFDIVATCGHDGKTGSVRFWMNGVQVYDTQLLQITLQQLYLFFGLLGETATVKTMLLDYVGRIYG